MTGLGEHSSLNPSEISIVVKMSVRDTLEELGIDLSTPAGREAARKDYAYMRAQRLGSENISEWIKKSIYVAVVSGALYALWNGIKLAVSLKGGVQ